MSEFFHKINRKDEKMTEDSQSFSQFYFQLVLKSLNVLCMSQLFTVTKFNVTKTSSGSLWCIVSFLSFYLTWRENKKGCQVSC